MVDILGSGYGVRTSRLFTYLKSEINRTDPLFFRMMNVGDTHSDSGCHFNSPISSSRLTSFFRVSKWIRDTGNGLPWYGFAPSFVFNSFPAKVVLAGTRAKQKKARTYGTRTDATYPTRCIAYGTRLKLRADVRNIFLTSRE